MPRQKQIYCTSKGRIMEIDFDTINEEIESKELITIDQFDVQEPERVLAQSINLTPFIEASQSFEIVDRESARQGLAMSLQARKMRQSLDKTRSEIIRPHLDFQRAVNKFAKSFEQKLTEIETGLTEKLKIYMEANQENQYVDLMNQSITVEDGKLSKKLTWQFEIEDETLIPREYLCIDEKKIKLAIKQGLRVIAGLKIEEKIEIDLRVKN